MKSKGKKGVLGRGLDQLLGPAYKLDDRSHSLDLTRRVPIDHLMPGKFQPRGLIDQNALEELSASIRRHGLLQPVLVRACGEKYEIIAGERRYRASLLAGLTTIDIIVKKSSDEDVALLALIENVQRQDLTPLESAHGFQRLVSQFGYTHEQIADMTGCSRSAITNRLRLLALCQEVQCMLEAGDLDMGHARALLGLDAISQLNVAKQVIRQNLSVRATENLVSSLQIRKEKSPEANQEKNVFLLEISERLSDKILSNVKIESKNNGRGQIIINYNSLNDLERIVKLFGK